LDDHDHVPNHEESDAEIVKYSLKRKVENQPQLSPDQILRKEMAGLSDGVLSQLPYRDNFKKSMRQVRKYLFIPHFHEFNLIVIYFTHQEKFAAQSKNTF